MLTHKPQTLAAIGDTIRKTIGRTVVELQWVRDGAYNVTTYQGTLRIEEHCKAWSTEEEARAYAYMLTCFYNEPLNYVWPCGCNDTGWIHLGNGVERPCSGCNPDGTNTPRPVPEGG